MKKGNCFEDENRNETTEKTKCLCSRIYPHIATQVPPGTGRENLRLARSAAKANSLTISQRLKSAACFMSPLVGTGDGVCCCEGLPAGLFTGANCVFTSCGFTLGR